MLVRGKRRGVATRVSASLETTLDMIGVFAAVSHHMVGRSAVAIDAAWRGASQYRVMALCWSGRFHASSSFISGSLPKRSFASRVVLTRAARRLQGGNNAKPAAVAAVQVRLVCRRKRIAHCSRIRRRQRHDNSKRAVSGQPAEGREGHLVQPVAVWRWPRRFAARSGGRGLASLGLWRAAVSLVLLSSPSMLTTRAGNLRRD